MFEAFGNDGDAVIVKPKALRIILYRFFDAFIHFSFVTEKLSYILFVEEIKISGFSLIIFHKLKYIFKFRLLQLEEYH